MGDPTTYFYQLTYDKKEKNDTQIIPYFIMHRLGLFINVDSSAAHLFYAWSFSHSVSVKIYEKENKKFLSLNTNTTVFAWGSGNSNKNGMERVYKLTREKNNRKY